GIEIATVFLDNQLAVKRFTPEAAKIVNLAPTDVGRPLGHFTTHLKYDRLVHDAREVLESLLPKTVEVEAGDGSWYNLRILPYRTLDNVIDGVVMTFADITALKQLEASLRVQQPQPLACPDCAQPFAAAVREPLVVLDSHLRIVAASRSFYRYLASVPAPPGESPGQTWELPGLQSLVHDVLSRDLHLDDYRLEHEFSNLGRRVLLLNARRLAGSDPLSGLVALAIDDITEVPARPALS
ncbi:MAG: PAS domain-containing protein, partial [Thermoguttaceae bacterium]